MKLNLTGIYNKLTTPRAYSTYATIGVLVTTGLAIYCTKKQCESEKNTRTDISENQDEVVKFEPAEMTREEVIEEAKQVAKAYGPVIASAAATIFCIKKANSKWIEYNSLINAGYIAARDKMARYRALAPAAVGAEVIKNFGDRGEAEEGVEWYCLKKFADDVPDVYFKSTPLDVVEAILRLNHNFIARDGASVREFYALLGILDQFPANYDDTMGWNPYKIMDSYDVAPWIDIFRWSVTTEDNVKITILSFETEPALSEDGEPFASHYGPTGTDYFGFSFSPRE